MRLEYGFEAGFSELQEIIRDEKQKIRAGEREGSAAPVGEIEARKNIYAEHRCRGEREIERQSAEQQHPRRFCGNAEERRCRRAAFPCVSSMGNPLFFFRG